MFVLRLGRLSSISIDCAIFTLHSHCFIYISPHSVISVTPQSHSLSITFACYLSGKLELEMQVLTTGYWPTAPPCATLILPEEITTRVEAFESFYRYAVLVFLFIFVFVFVVLMCMHG